jgi:hypothetical protein
MSKTMASPFVVDPSMDGSGLSEATDPQILVDGLAELVQKPMAISLVPEATKAPVNATPLQWLAPEAPLDVVDAFSEAVKLQMASEGPLGYVHLAEYPDWAAWAEPVRIDQGSGIGALVVLRESITPWSDAEISTIRVFATMCGTHWARQTAEFQRSLDELVTHVAERLMVASPSTMQETLDWTIATLAEFIHSDVAFYRRNDHAADVSILVAEYPKRTETRWPSCRSTPTPSSP